MYLFKLVEATKYIKFDNILWMQKLSSINRKLYISTSESLDFTTYNNVRSLWQLYNVVLQFVTQCISTKLSTQNELSWFWNLLTQNLLHNWFLEIYTLITNDQRKFHLSSLIKSFETFAFAVEFLGFITKSMPLGHLPHFSLCHFNH